MKASLLIISGVMVLFLGSPASAGKIVRSRSQSREVVTIVDHGSTRGRPAVRRGGTRPASRRATTSVAASATVDNTPDATVAQHAPPQELSVMANEAVTSILRLRLAHGDTDMPDVGT